MSSTFCPTQVIEFACGVTISGNPKDVNSKQKRHYRHCKFCVSNNTKKPPLIDSVVNSSVSEVMYNKHLNKNGCRKLTKFEDTLLSTDITPSGCRLCRLNPDSLVYKKAQAIEHILNMITRMKNEGLKEFKAFEKYNSNILYTMEYNTLLNLASLIAYIGISLKENKSETEEESV
jgi:hypothetical protein